MTAPSPQTPEGIRITATQFNYLDDCWMYQLEDKSVVSGRIGDARIPCGMQFTERNQWGANQLAKLKEPVS